MLPSDVTLQFEEALEGKRCIRCMMLPKYSNTCDFPDCPHKPSLLARYWPMIIVAPALLLACVLSIWIGLTHH